MRKSVTLLGGDCLDVLKGLPANSVDACVTDPPYHLTTGKKGGSGPRSLNENSPAGRARIATGFMGKSWDGGDIAFRPEVWREVLRVLKPGGHLLSFGGTRTYHRMVCAIEDAGFEIRDTIMWVYGSGFPKSHDVSKGIDRLGPSNQAPFAEFAAHYETRRKILGLTHAKICAAGGWYGEVNHGGSSVNWANGYGMPTISQWAVLQPLLGLDDRWKERVQREEYEREKIGERVSGDPVAWFAQAERGDGIVDITTPGSAAARQWEGWGTALKPACEPIVVARKPCSERTVAANVLRWGTGALNIDGCRVGIDGGTSRGANGSNAGKPRNVLHGGNFGVEKIDAGRWPANVIHDGSEEVTNGFPHQSGGGTPKRRHSDKFRNTYGEFKGRAGEASADQTYTGKGGTNFAMKPGRRSIGPTSGNAARFFYCAKASKKERRGSKHPTVKPIALLRYLVRLVTPPGGKVLDPFAGTGTTGEAAAREGMRAILIEREAEYRRDIRRRLKGIAPCNEDTPRRPLPKAARPQTVTRLHPQRNGVHRLRRHDAVLRGVRRAAAA